MGVSTHSPPPMILADGSTFLSIGITLVTLVIVIVSALMILVVMMQRPKQEGLGAAFGGGMTDQLLGAGTTSFLQKATVILGILFFFLSFALGLMVSRQNKADGLTDLSPTGESTAAPALGEPSGGLDEEVDSDISELLESAPVVGGENEEGSSEPNEEASESSSSEETSASEVEEDVEDVELPVIDATEELPSVIFEAGEEAEADNE